MNFIDLDTSLFPNSDFRIDSKKAKLLGLTDGENVKFTGITDQGFYVKNLSDKPLIVTIRFTNQNGSKDQKYQYRFDVKHTREVKNPFPGERVMGLIYGEKLCPREAPMTAVEMLEITKPSENAYPMWKVFNPTQRYIYTAFDTYDTVKGIKLNSFTFIPRPFSGFFIGFEEDIIKIDWFGADFEPN